MCFDLGCVVRVVDMVVYFLNLIRLPVRISLVQKCCGSALALSHRCRIGCGLGGDMGWAF